MTTGEYLLDELRHEHGEGRLVLFLGSACIGGVPWVGRHDRAARTNRREPSASGNRTGLICTRGGRQKQGPKPRVALKRAGGAFTQARVRIETRGVS
jgi:hypothetical protein